MNKLVSNNRLKSFVSLCLVLVLGACAQADLPAARNLAIPSPAMAEPRPESINEAPDSVLYLPLGSDVLVPEAVGAGQLPLEYVGPFELRSETVAGALQLVMADYEVPLAFETEEGLTRTVTVANLRGPLNRVVHKICSLADLYCAYEDGLLVVKETQTFTVTVPPVGEDTEVLDALSTGIEAITGATPITEEATRTIIYEATNRTSEIAERYFQRLRSSTALIVFEVYIWEVALESENATGVDWEKIDTFGKFNLSFDLQGSADTDLTPISIGLPTTDSTFAAADVLEFISSYGAVKTISQPQITVLSGAEATLRAADTVNYVSSLERSVDDGEVTVSTETDSVDTGFTLTISSSWDSSTIYGNIAIELQEFQGFDNFDADGTTLRLPQTTEREVSTQVRIRPGDSLLIAGLVRESDEYDSSGPGFAEPILPTSRGADVSNRELVFLLKPRVIVYTSDDSSDRTNDISIVRPAEGDKDIEKFPLGTIPLNLLDPSGF